MTSESERPPDGLPPEEDEEMANRLLDQRPIPTAGFRGSLERYLAAVDPRLHPRPAQLRLIVTAYLGVGLLLMLLGALAAGVL